MWSLHSFFLIFHAIRVSSHPLMGSRRRLLCFVLYCREYKNWHSLISFKKISSLKNESRFFCTSYTHRKSDQHFIRWWIAQLTYTLGNLTKGNPRISCKNWKIKCMKNRQHSRAFKNVEFQVSIERGCVFSLVFDFIRRSFCFSSHQLAEAISANANSTCSLNCFNISTSPTRNKTESALALAQEKQRERSLARSVKWLFEHASFDKKKHRSVKWRIDSRNHMILHQIGDHLEASPQHLCAVNLNNENYLFTFQYLTIVRLLSQQLQFSAVETAAEMRETIVITSATKKIWILLESNVLNYSNSSLVLTKPLDSLKKKNSKLFFLMLMLNGRCRDRYGRRRSFNDNSS